MRKPEVVYSWNKKTHATENRKAGEKAISKEHDFSFGIRLLL